VAVEHSCC